MQPGVAWRPAGACAGASPPSQRGADAVPRRARAPNGWSSAAPGGPVADGYGSAGVPPWPSASSRGVGCNDSSPAPPAGGHGPEPSHAGYRRRTRLRPGWVGRFSRKGPPFGKRGEGEDDRRPTARASAAAKRAQRAKRSAGSAGWAGFYWVLSASTISLIAWWSMGILFVTTSQTIL